MKPPKTAFEAMVMALELSVSVPTDEQSEQCLLMAETIAVNFSEIEVARAKKVALANLQANA
jgi:hypothetical protein